MQARGQTHPARRWVYVGDASHPYNAQKVRRHREDGALTPDEIATMRTHAHLGYKLVLKSPHLAEAAELVYAHHEIFDTDLPYRPAWSFSVARGEIQRCCGTQFDPAVVSVLLEMADEIREDLRREDPSAKTRQ